MNLKMSDPILRELLGTGPLKPASSGTDPSTSAPSGTDPFTSAPSGSNPSTLETETDSVKSGPRESLYPRLMSLPLVSYPRDFKSRTVYSPSAPSLEAVHNIVYDAAKALRYNEPSSYEFSSKGSQSRAVQSFVDLGTLSGVVKEQSFVDVCVVAPQISTRQPFVNIEHDNCALARHKSSRTYLVPSQQFLFPPSPILPETIIGDSLMARAARSLLPWPIAWRELPSSIQISGAIMSREIPGDFHYIHIITPPGNFDIFLQATDLEVYALSAHNPKDFGPCAALLDGKKYFMGTCTEVNWPFISYFIRHEYIDLIWASMMYNTHTLTSIAHAYCVTDVILDRFSRMLNKNPRMLTWKPKNLLKISKYCLWCDVDPVLEIELPRKFPSSYSSFQRKVQKVRQKRSHIMLQMQEVEIQGIDSLFQWMSGSYEPEIFRNVREIGKLSSNVNTVTDFFTSHPMNNILGLAAEIVHLVAGLLTDSCDFINHPVEYVRNLLRSVRSDFHVPHYTLYEGLVTTFGMVAAFFIFETNPTAASVTFFLANYGHFFRMFDNRDSARKCATLATMIFICVAKAIQSPPASVSLQGPSALQGAIITACGGIALLISGVKTHGSDVGLFEYLGKNSKDLFLTSRGLLSLASVLEYVFSTIKLALEYLLGDTAMYKALVKITITNNDLKDYIIYSLSKTAEELSTTLTMDAKAREEWERMCSLHNHFLTIFSAGKNQTESHVGFAMYSKAFNKFITLKEEFLKIKDSLDYFRPEPFMIWLWGEPGTGKTWCRDQLVNNMYRWHMKVDPTIPDAKTTGLIYVRNPADKYMSNYVGQFAVAYDDVGQNRQTDNPEFNEIMAIGSTNQVRLNMADLNEKGRLFSSKVIVMASNTHDVNANDLILKEDAFNRRRHVVVQVLRPKKQGETISTSTCDFSQVALNLTNPHNSAQVKRFPSTGYGPSKEVWMAMYKWLAPRYVSHVRNQKKLLEEKMSELTATLEGEQTDLLFDFDEESADSEEFTVAALDFDSIKLQSQDPPSENPPIEVSPSLARQRKCLSRISNKVDRFTLACLMNVELGTAADCYKELAGPFTKENLCHVYKRFVGEDLDETLLVVSPPISPLDEEHLAKAWELYQVNRGGCEFPWKKFFVASGAVLSVIGLIKMWEALKTSKPSEIQGYESQPQAPPRNTVVLNRYDHQPNAPPKNTVVLQSVTEDLLKIYRRALFRAECITDDGYIPRFRAINFVQIAYDIFLAPKHFFKRLNTKFLRLSNDSHTYPQIEIQDEHITEVDELDFVLVRIPEVNYGKNILSHFPTRDEIKAIVAFNSLVISWSKKQNETVLNYTGEAKRWDLPINVAFDNTLICFPKGYKYQWESSPGDCGSLLIALDNACNSKIMGVHFGYDSAQSKGLSAILTRECLQKHVDLLKPVKIEVEDPQIVVLESPCPEVLMNSEDRPLFEYLGQVNGAPSQPRRHKNLFRSPLYGHIYPPEKDLSVLSCNDERMLPEHQGPPDILTRGVLDFAYTSRCWPQYALNLAKDCLRSEFNRFTERVPREVCSLEWAINGEWSGDQRVEHTEPLRLDTSSGYGLVGKKVRHFDVTDPKNIVISNPVLQIMVDKQWDSWMGGKTYPTIWVHALKSEPVKMSKIVNGNTRTFCVAQTCFLLNVKRLFGAWIVAMKCSKIKTFSCLGIDPESGDWTDLYNALRDNSPLGIDLDFFKFDRTAVTWQLASAVVAEINAWYNDSEENQRARFIAMDDMIHSYCLIGSHLTRKDRGNPSGNPITTELNNSVNYLMLAMVYFIIAKRHSPTDLHPNSFRKKIVPRTYGDDLIFSVSPRDMDWFTTDRIQDVYSYFGVPVTPADKSDSGLRYQTIDQLTFLKRSFLPFDHPQFPWQAALSQTSIRSMIAFYRLAPNAGTVQDAVIVNMEQSLEFAYHWGRDFFQEHANKLEKWLREHDWPSLALSYEIFDIRYRSKLGIE